MKKLEIGQKVVVRPRLSVGRKYGSENFVDEMLRFRNKKVTIEQVIDDTCYRIKEDEGEWCWDIQMFVPESLEVKIKLEDGQRVKVFDNSYGLFPNFCDKENGTFHKMSNGRMWVEFDISRSPLHNADGRGKEQSCWYITETKGLVKLVEEETKSDDGKLDKLIETVNKLAEVNKASKFEEAMIQGIIEKSKELATEDLKKEIKTDLDKFIQETYGILPKKIVIENNHKTKELTGLFHKDFEKICKIVASNIPLMLVGGAGAGKNYTLEQVAETLGLDFYTTNSVNQEYKLTGFIDANGNYHETEFYKAFVNGGMFFLDEIDASSPEALIILNGAIANKYFDFPTGRVKAHKDFRVVCAGNTYGTGADMVYVGRNVLDGATLDRFVVLQFDYDDNVEKQLAYDNELFNFIRDLRKAVSKTGLRYIISMRALINSTKLLEIGVDKKTILETTIIKNMQKDDLNLIVNELNSSNEWYKEIKGMCD